eukprot:1155052-Pelagomonas_calceolata.AAC.3
MHGSVRAITRREEEQCTATRKACTYRTAVGGSVDHHPAQVRECVKAMRVRINDMERRCPGAEACMTN